MRSLRGVPIVAVVLALFFGLRKGRKRQAERGCGQKTGQAERHGILVNNRRQE